MEMTIYFPKGKKVNADFQKFTVETDQSIEDGGEDSAPQPLSLFLASIGTCTGHYVNSFCQKRNINTKNIKLFLNAKRDEKTHLFYKIDIKIQVPKDFPEIYYNALIKSASLCSVKKHLENPPEINLSLNKE